MSSVYTSYKNCVLFYILVIINPVTLRGQHNQIRAVENILSNNKPIVLVLQEKRQEKKSDFDNIFTDDEDGLLDNDDYDNKRTYTSYVAYVLRHLLRTDNIEELYSSTDETKQVLRSALRARCNKVQRCVKKCPPKQPICPQNCQEVFDNSNLCSQPPKPKECKKSRCGKTMPPSWKF